MVFFTELRSSWRDCGLLSDDDDGGGGGAECKCLEEFEEEIAFSIISVSVLAMVRDCDLKKL